MAGIEEYYNHFYKDLALLDAAGNSYAKIAALIAPELAKGYPLRVLDLGCGYGSVSAPLVRHGFQVYGVEIGDAALRALRERGLRPIKCDLARRLPIADSVVDVVLALDVLEHVFNPLAVLMEAWRILRDGGALVLSVPLYFDVMDRARLLVTGSILSYDNLVYGRQLARRFRSYNYDHIRFFRPKDVDEMLTIAGFRVQERLFGPILSPQMLAPLRPVLRLLAKFLPGFFAHSVRIRAAKT